MDKSMMAAAPEAEAGMVEEGAGDYSVTITCHTDGTYTVTGESSSQEMAEGGEEGAEPAGQAAKTADEALQLAKSMLESGMGDDQMSVEQAFSDGFKGDEVDQPVRGRY